MQQWHGLKWEFSPRSNRVNFMDLTIVLQWTGHLSTNLFEKQQNLYLYMPPSSAHHPSNINGRITGNIFHIYQQCSAKSGIKKHIQCFHDRLVA
jgi:hypothetical protein